MVNLQITRLSGTRFLQQRIFSICRTSFFSTEISEENKITSEPIIKHVQYPYYIKRTPGGGLPIYSKVAGAGTRIETLIRKIDGNVHALMEDLTENFPDDKIWINQRTLHIHFKGNRARELREWATQRGF